VSADAVRDFAKQPHPKLKRLSCNSLNIPSESARQLQADMRAAFPAFPIYLD
jgi:hypothetical protein